LAAVLVPAVPFAPRDPEEPDDGPEPELDALLEALAREEEEEEQDEEPPVSVPDSDAPATALPCPVADDGESPVVGTTVVAWPDSHPAFGSEVDADEDEFDGADDAGGGDPALEEPAGEAVAPDCEPAAAAVDELEEPVGALLD
jgi:hypothetical protein